MILDENTYNTYNTCHHDLITYNNCTKYFDCINCKKKFNYKKCNCFIIFESQTNTKKHSDYINIQNEGVVCTQCGVCVNTDNLNEEPEWREFDDEKKQNRTNYSEQDFYDKKIDTAQACIFRELCFLLNTPDYIEKNAKKHCVKLQNNQSVQLIIKNQKLFICTLLFIEYVANDEIFDFQKIQKKFIKNINLVYLHAKEICTIMKYNILMEKIITYTKKSLFNSLFKIKITKYYNLLSKIKTKYDEKSKNPDTKLFEQKDFCDTLNKKYKTINLVNFQKFYKQFEDYQKSFNTKFVNRKLKSRTIMMVCFLKTIDLFDHENFDFILNKLKKYKFKLGQNVMEYLKTFD